MVGTTQAAIDEAIQPGIVNTEEAQCLWMELAKIFGQLCGIEIVVKMRRISKEIVCWNRSCQSRSSMCKFWND